MVAGITVAATAAVVGMARETEPAGATGTEGAVAATGGGVAGGLARCPLVARGATLEAIDTDAGVTVRLSAKDPAAAAALRQQVFQQAGDAGLGFDWKPAP